MRKAYKLIIYTRDLEEITYPIELDQVYLDIDLFSTKKKLLEVLKKEVSNLDYNEKFEYYSIQELGIDKPIEYTIQLFDYSGKIMDFSPEKKFLGRSNCKFKPGDLVEFFDHGKIEVGVIFATPFSQSQIAKYKMAFGTDDDCYLIDLLNGEHSHVRNFLVRGVPKSGKLSDVESKAYQALKDDVIDRLQAGSNKYPKVIKLDDFKS